MCTFSLCRLVSGGNDAEWESQQQLVEEAWQQLIQVMLALACDSLQTGWEGDDTTLDMLRQQNAEKRCVLSDSHPAYWQLTATLACTMCT